MSLNFVTIEHSPNAKDMLKKPCKSIDFPLSQEIIDLIEEMKKKMIAEDGVGLAANQIGQHIRLAIYHVPEDALDFREDATEVVPITVLINPKYTPIPEEGLVTDWEGCFSVAETVGKVPRYKAIQYEAQDTEGRLIQEIARGFRARVIQHEIDHLDGLLILDRLTPDCIHGSKEEMMKYRKMEFEERMAKKNGKPK